MEELYRNLGLAFVCVFVTTLLLLSNVAACLQVLLCVVLTLVNVAGFMHFWGEYEWNKSTLGTLELPREGNDKGIYLFEAFIRKCTLALSVATRVVFSA